MPDNGLIPYERGETAKTLPHNLEAEQALLGSILVNNKALERVGDFLEAKHFYDPLHGRIYDQIRILNERGLAATPVTLRGFFEGDQSLSSLGGTAYLTELAANVVTIVNAEDYGKLIHDLALRRALIEIGQHLVIDALQQEADRPATEQIEDAEQQLFELATTGEVQKRAVSLRESLGAAIRMAEAAFKRSSHVTGVTTGLRDMDRKLGGLHPSDLIILAGRPSMGKTALATNMAYNAARAQARSDGREGAGVAFFSLEMSAEQLATRILADRVEISSHKIRQGEVRAEDFTRFLEASRELEKLQLFIDDTPALTIAQVRTRSRRLKRLHPGLGLIVIDYLQLLRGSGPTRDNNRVQEISEISRGLKAIAKELNVPVLALSQLSRAVEQREDKRPQLSDLRESGSIEQDADVVMFVYREEYYHERAEPKQREDEPPDKFSGRHARWLEHADKIHNVAEVLVQKQRHGPIGNVRLFFDAQFTRFADLADDHLPSPE